MISWQTHSFKPWLRTVAFLTVCVFTFTSVVWDGGNKAYASAANPPSVTPVETFKTNAALSLIDRPDLPDSFGTIKGTFKGNRDQIVLAIQDAHINEEAQRNIAHILQYFSEKYQLGLVNLEGASGELYTELFSFFPDKEARRSVADYFLKEGRLTGPEYLAIVEKPAMTLYGVEDKDLYEENRKAYVDALQFKDRDEKILAELDKVLEGVSRFVFPEEMRELTRRRAAFQEGGPELVSYVRYLVELARKHNIALDEYPGMHSLIELVDLEKQVDFDKAEKETDELINDLKRSLSRDKLSRFLTNTVHFRMKKMKRAAYYGYLQDEIQGMSVTQSGGEDLNAKYANVMAYVKYMKLYDAIDVSIFDEIEFLEKTVKNKLFTTPEQVQLDHVLRIHDIYSKMFDFSLTKQDAEFYYTYQEEFKSQTFVDFLTPLMSKYHFTYGLPSQVKTLDQDLPRVERFYKAALERDQVLIERAVEKTLSSGQKVSAIVTGGFHTPGIEKYLREQDISYIVVAPRISGKIDKKKENALYDAALRETPLSIEKVLSEVFLQPKSPVLNDPRFQLAAWRMILSREEAKGLNFNSFDSRDVSYFVLNAALSILKDPSQSKEGIKAALLGDKKIEEGDQQKLDLFLSKFNPKAIDGGNLWVPVGDKSGDYLAFKLHEGKKTNEVSGAILGTRRSIPSGDKVLSFVRVRGALVPDAIKIAGRAELKAADETTQPAPAAVPAVNSEAARKLEVAPAVDATTRASRSEARTQALREEARTAATVRAHLSAYKDVARKFGYLLPKDVEERALETPSSFTLDKEIRKKTMAFRDMLVDPEFAGRLEKLAAFKALNLSFVFSSEKEMVMILKWGRKAKVEVRKKYRELLAFLTAPTPAVSPAPASAVVPVATPAEKTPAVVPAVATPVSETADQVRGRVEREQGSYFGSYVRRGVLGWGFLGLVAGVILSAIMQTTVIAFPIVFGLVAFVLRAMRTRSVKSGIATVEANTKGAGWVVTSADGKKWLEGLKAPDFSKIQDKKERRDASLNFKLSNWPAYRKLHASNIFSEDAKSEGDAKKTILKFVGLGTAIGVILGFTTALPMIATVAVSALAGGFLAAAIMKMKAEWTKQGGTQSLVKQGVFTAIGLALKIFISMPYHLLDGFILQYFRLRINYFILGAKSQRWITDAETQAIVENAKTHEADKNLSRTERFIRTRFGYGLWVTLQTTQVAALAEFFQKRAKLFIYGQFSGIVLTAAGTSLPVFAALGVGFWGYIIVKQVIAYRAAQNTPGQSLPKHWLRNRILGHLIFATIFGGLMWLGVSPPSWAVASPAAGDVATKALNIFGIPLPSIPAIPGVPHFDLLHLGAVIQTKGTIFGFLGDQVHLTFQAIASSATLNFLLAVTTQIPNKMREIMMRDTMIDIVRALKVQQANF